MKSTKQVSSYLKAIKKYATDKKSITKAIDLIVLEDLEEIRESIMNKTPFNVKGRYFSGIEKNNSGNPLSELFLLPSGIPPEDLDETKEVLSDLLINDKMGFLAHVMTVTVWGKSLDELKVQEDKVYLMKDIKNAKLFSIGKAVQFTTNASSFENFLE